MSSGDESAEELLAVRGLVAGYGFTTVLRGLDMTVDARRIVAVVGPNGAGKTTLARALTGFAKITAGSVRIGGTEMVGVAAHRRARAGLVQVPEGRRLFARFSVEQNLAMAFMGGGRRLSRARQDELLARAFDLFPILAVRRTQLAGTLSGGEQQMLSIARAILLEPRVLVLDEPSTGLAPMVVTQILEVVRELVSATGACCVLIEQRAQLALEVSDYGYVLERGNLVLEGPPQRVLDDPLLQRGYVGL